MTTFGMLLMFAIATCLVAWVTNGLVSLLSGEHSRDTGRLWIDAFLRVFAVIEFGWIGRVLNHIGLHGLMKKLALFVGLLGLLVFLVGSCDHSDDDGRRYIHHESSQEL